MQNIFACIFVCVKYYNDISWQVLRENKQWLRDCKCLPGFVIHCSSPPPLCSDPFSPSSVRPVDSSYGLGCCFLSEKHKGLLETITHSRGIYSQNMNPNKALAPTSDL